MRRRDRIRNSSQISVNGDENDNEIGNDNDNNIHAQEDNIFMPPINDGVLPYHDIIMNSQNVLQDIMVDLPLVNVGDVVNDIIQLGLNMTEECIKINNDLKLAASGIVPVTLLCNQPSIRQSMNTFIKNIFNNVLRSCTVCKENWFAVLSLDENVMPYECVRCIKEKKDSVKKNIEFVGSMSASNNMDPYYHISQVANDELKELECSFPLNNQEQALIAISTPIMSFFKLKGPRDGQNIGFKGNVINIAQDLTKICSILPRLPADCNVFKIRSIRGSDPSNYKDFVVRKERVHKWLMFLKKWNPAYKNVVISIDNLNLLPENDSVYAALSELVVRNNLINNDVNDVVANIDAMIIDNDNNNIDDNDDDNDDGGNVYGLVGGPIENELNDSILETGIALDLVDINIADAIVNDINPIIQINDVIEWPQLAPVPYDEYNTPFLLTNAFPCLFPFGSGDVTDKIRMVAISLHDAAEHYLKYGKIDCNGKIVHPFGSDVRFCHYIQDMDERHRIQSQASVYLEKNPLDANLSIGELKEMARGVNNPSAFAANLRMQRYSGNILGSNQYMMLRKKELIALMCVKKIATVWFTLSLANHHWDDLQNLFGSKPAQLPDESDVDFIKRCKKIAMKNYANNPAIVNEMFVKRVKLFMQSFFGETGLNSEWHWYRYEWQKRGNIHVHGLARLKSDPGLSKLGEDVAKGRKAQKMLEMYLEIKKELGDHIPTILNDLIFIAPPNDDEHLPYTLKQLTLKFNDRLFQFTVVEIEALIDTMNRGHNSELCICVYRDYLLTSMNPVNASDSMKSVRDNDYIVPEIHPCSICHTTITGTHIVGGDDFDITYSNMLQSCQRHKHTPSYCINSFGKCRFNFPRPIENKTRVVIKDHPYKLGNNKGLLRKTTCEIVFKCNDRWLNSHCIIGFVGWGANIDMSILIDSRSVIEYVAKYCNKVETGSNGLSSILSGVLRYGNEIGNLETKTILRRCFNRLAGRRDKCTQETSHLILSSPIVVCTNAFIMINLTSLIRQVNIQHENDDAPALKLNLLDVYKIRKLKTTWKNPRIYDVIESDLQLICFASFVELYSVSKDSKICCRVGNQLNAIPIFSPDFKAIPNTINYYKSCWFALLKYKPWINNCETLLDEEVPLHACTDIDDASSELQDNIISSWESYMNNPANINNPNDNILREIDRFQNEIHLNDDEGDLISQNGLFSAADEQPEFNQIFRNVTNIVLDDDSETVAWNSEYNFDNNDNHYILNEISPSQLKLKHAEITLLKQPMMRPPIFLDGLQRQQKNAVIAFLHICGVMKDLNNQFIPKKQMQNSTIPNAMIITGTAGTGKSYTIDGMITELLSRLDEKGIHNMEVLVLAPTGRAAMQAKGFTLHCAEGLSIPLLSG